MAALVCAQPLSSMFQRTPSAKTHRAPATRRNFAESEWAKRKKANERERKIDFLSGRRQEVELSSAAVAATAGSLFAERRARQGLIRPPDNASAALELSAAPICARASPLFIHFIQNYITSARAATDDAASCRRRSPVARPPGSPMINASGQIIMYCQSLERRPNRREL